MTARRKVSEVNTFRHMGRTFYILDKDLSGQTVVVDVWTHQNNGYNLRAAVWGEHSFLYDNWDAIAETHEDDSPSKKHDDAHREEWRRLDESELEWWQRVDTD